MGVTVVLAISDRHDITNKAIEYLLENANKPNEVQIIVIDNASMVPYTINSFNGYPLLVIRNDINIGATGALVQSLDSAANDIILWMHNDVLVHEQGWDTRIIDAFTADPLLAIAGFFGGYGVVDNGGRIGSMGNMLGKEWGTPQHMHGDIMTDIHPAVVFDALAIIVHRKLVIEAEIPFDELPPHHWTDRILPLLFLEKGYHAATIGIAFDHHGGVTSLGDTYRTLAEDWSKSKGLAMVKDWDYTLYHAGEMYFYNRWRGKFPVYVDKHYNVRWGR